jgi:hypothetical protein
MEGWYHKPINRLHVKHSIYKSSTLATLNGCLAQPHWPHQPDVAHQSELSSPSILHHTTWRVDTVVTTGNSMSENLTVQLPTATSGMSRSPSQIFHELQFHRCGAHELVTVFTVK